MWDTLLEIGSAFDWISPIGSLVGDVLNGPSHTFLIPIDSCGYSGRDIARMLKRRGVDSWGHMIVSGTLMISVRQTQARWAQHLLDRAGIPVEHHVACELANRSPQTTTSSDRRRRSGSLADTLREIGDLRIF
jgi:hypothetical protein